MSYNDCKIMNSSSFRYHQLYSTPGPLGNPVDPSSGLLSSPRCHPEERGISYACTLSETVKMIHCCLLDMTNNSPAFYFPYSSAITFGGQPSQTDALRKTRSGLNDLINATFLDRFHPLISFFRAMAALIQSNCS